MLAPFDGVLLHQVEFFVGQLAGFFEHAVIHADFSHVVQERGDAQAVEVFGVQAQRIADDQRILGHAPGVTAGVGILFVDGRGEHADGAQKQLAVFLGGELQALDVFLDVAGHLIEGFGELADFGGAAHLHALVKFGAADGARGFDQAANGAGDAEREEISQGKRHEHDADHEAQGLRGQFFDAGVHARVGQAALRDDRPAELRDGAVGAEHLDGMARVLAGHEEIGGCGGAQFLRQLGDRLGDGGRGGDVAAGNHVARVGIGDDVAVDVDDVDGAVAHADVAQARLQRIERDDGGKHSGKLAVGQQRHGHHQGRAVVPPQRERLADGIEALNAGGEGALERGFDKGIMVGAEAAGRLSFGLLVDGGDVEDVGIVFDEGLQQRAKSAARARGRPRPGSIR